VFGEPGRNPSGIDKEESMKRIAVVTLAVAGFASANIAQERAVYGPSSFSLRGREWSIETLYASSIMDWIHLLQTCGNRTWGANTNGYPQKGDPVVLYTANEVREVVDLDVWSPVGRDPLRWTRWGNSRLPKSRTSPFGNSHNWRHGYQWELTLSVTDTGTVATVSEPQGTAHQFMQGIDGVWTPITYVPTVGLTATDSVMTVTVNNGTRVRFTQVSSTASGSTWRPDDITDSDGNVLALAYDVDGRLSRISDAGGHFLDIGWTNLLAWVGDFRTVRTIGESDLLDALSGDGSLTPGAGVDLDLPAETNARYIRYLAPDFTHGRIAELELFYSPGFEPQIWDPGAFFGAPASPGRAFGHAFDESPVSWYESVVPNGGFVGIGFISGKRVVAARVSAAPTPDNTVLGGKIQVSTARPDLVPAISSVTASDGRQVRYEYSQLVDTALMGYVWQQMTSVRYGDGTSAELTYSQVVPGSRPLVTRFVEPRYTLPFADIEVDYFDTRIGTHGQVRMQKTADGCVLSILTIDGDALHKPMLLQPIGNHSREHVNGVHARVDKEFDGLDRQTTFKRDASGFVTNVTDALGRQTKYGRTPLGNELSVQFPNGRILEWTRDDLDLPLMLIERGAGIGVRTNRWTRDALHRVTRLDHPNGGYETFEYNALGQVVSHRLPNDGSETFEYDAQGRRTKKTDAVGGVWLYGYNEPDGTSDFSGNLVDNVTDPRGNVTQFLYTERGLLARVIWPDNTGLSMEYDLFGNLVRETDELGKSWVHAYDNLKRRVSTTDPLGNVTQWVFRPDCYQEKPVEIILPSGRKTVLAYDAAWRLVSRAEAAGTAEEATTLFGFDDADNLVSVTEPGGGVWQMLYNNDDRRVSLTDPLGNVTSNVFDKAGNLLAEIRPDGTTWTNAYSKMDWKTHAVDPLGQTTRFVYNAAGNLTSLTDAVGRAHSFTFDKLGRRLTMKFPDASVEKYQFDKAGNMTGVVNRAGAKLRLAYDSRNRLLSRTWSDGTPGAEFTYDAAGRVLSIVNANSALSYAFDDAGRLLSETQALAGQPQAHTVSYGWDEDGRPAALGYPSGLEVAYAYGARGLMSGITAGGGYLAGILRDDDGRRAAMLLPNSTRTEYSHDAAGQLTGITHSLEGVGTPEQGPSSTAFATRGYDYNSIGLRTVMLSGSAGVGTLLDEYTHDPLDQLVRARYDSGSGTPVRDVQYSFDGVGNRLSVDDNGAVTPYVANDLNQYTSVAGIGLTYDANGNLAAGPGFTLTYDAQNRLIQATAATGSVTFAYDGRNRCVKRTTLTLEGGSSVWLVWGHAQSGQWGLLEERDSRGDLAARYVHGERIDEILRREGPEGTVYYHHDALGSTIALTDGSGALVEQYRYDVYGLPTILDASGAPIPLSALGSPLSALGNRFMFTGREWLSDLALYDYRNRVYSPLLGRWLQTDPIGFEAGDVNLYGYCGNAVLSGMDPMGLATIPWDIGWKVEGNRPMVNVAQRQRNWWSGQPGEFVPGSAEWIPATGRYLSQFEKDDKGRWRVRNARDRYSAGLAAAAGDLRRAQKQFEAIAGGYWGGIVAASATVTVGPAVVAGASDSLVAAATGRAAEFGLRHAQDIGDFFSGALTDHYPENFGQQLGSTASIIVKGIASGVQDWMGH
jgi:RHS repeat-associated protein